MEPNRTLELMFDDDPPSETPPKPWGEMAVVADPDDELPETVREPRPSRPDPETDPTT
jgi:hypothetical protein